MSPQEFERWLKHYGAVFPETTDWIGRLPEEQRGVMLDAWEKSLATVAFRDARAVTEKMLSGDPNYPPLGVMFGDRERTPIHIRRLAGQLQSERLAAEDKRRQDREQEEYRKLKAAGACRYKYGMGELYRFYMERLKAGDPDAKQNMRAMADELPGPGEDGYKPAEGYQELFTR